MPRRQRLHHPQRSRHSSFADDAPQRSCRSTLVHNYCARPNNRCTALAQRHVVNCGRRSTAFGTRSAQRFLRKTNAHSSFGPSLGHRPALPQRESLCSSMVLALSRRPGRLARESARQRRFRCANADRFLRSVQPQGGVNRVVVGAPTNRCAGSEDGMPTARGRGRIVRVRMEVSVPCLEARSSTLEACCGCIDVGGALAPVARVHFGHRMEDR